MEDIPLTEPVAVVVDHKRIMAEAIEHATRCLGSCDWDLIEEEELDPFQLCINDDTDHIRLVGTLRGSLAHWRGVWQSGIESSYESYESDIVAFAHVFSLLGMRYRASGFYHVYDVQSEQTVRFIFVSDPTNRKPHPVRPVDGAIGVWLRASGDEQCEVHLVTWADFHMSPSEAIRTFGLWGSQATLVGREMRKALLALQPPEAT